MAEPQDFVWGSALQLINLDKDDKVTDVARVVKEE